jgi:hypothetical protein
MIELLRERIERNYEDFKAKTLATLTKEDIFERAGHISAIEDVRFFLSTHDWLDEGEAKYLLSFNDPLEELAGKWEDWLTDSGCHLGQALNPLFGRDRDDEPDEYEYEYEYDFDDYN